MRDIATLQAILSIIGAITAPLLGIIAFFLRRLVNNQDKLVAEMSAIKDGLNSLTAAYNQSMISCKWRHDLVDKKMSDLEKKIKP